MHVFTSDWLKRMVLKSAKAPEARIANLFSILQDWLEAPGMREQVLAVGFDVQARQELHAFLLSLVMAAKLESPEKIAFQLQFMLVGALADELRNPGNHAMDHAAEAAAVMIAAAKPSRFAKFPMAAVASLAIVVVLMTGVLLVPSAPQPEAVTVTASLPKGDIVAVASRPDRIAAIYQMHERLQSAQCSYPQALMLAPEQRALFLQGVVNIDSLNTAASNLEEVSQLYQKVECSYAPAAMLL